MSDFHVTDLREIKILQLTVSKKFLKITFKALYEKKKKDTACKMPLS